MGIKRKARMWMKRCLAVLKRAAQKDICIPIRQFESRKQGQEAGPAPTCRSQMRADCERNVAIISAALARMLRTYLRVSSLSTPSAASRLHSERTRSMRRHLRMEVKGAQVVGITKGA